MLQKIINSKTATPTQDIGSKAANLLLMQQHGFHVPEFYIIDAKMVAQIRQDQTFLGDLLGRWKKDNDISENELWAVRSSSAVEDGSQQSHAGIFTTVTNVTGVHLEEAIKSVMNAYTPHTGASGIIIQRMIPADYSGVIFTRNPVDQNDKTIHVNLIPGLGENLVSGKEEAYSFSIINKELVADNPNDQYSGEVFDGKLTRIQKTRAEIESMISFFLPMIEKRSRELEKMKGCPVDIEFCIQGNKFYWLQVRPITGLFDNNIQVWDNTAAETNYPGLSLPLTISFARHSTREAYRGMAFFLAMPVQVIKENDPLLGNMMNGIQGSLYYNVTAWQQLIYQLPFGKKLSHRLPEIWGMNEAAFMPTMTRPGFLAQTKMFSRLFMTLLKHNRLRKKYFENVNTVLGVYEKAKLNQMTHETLVLKYKTMQSELGDNWSAPVVNGFFAALFFSLLKKMVSKSRLTNTHPNFANDVLFSQEDIISVLIVRRFQAIVSEIRTDPASKELFTRHLPEEISHKLPGINSKLSESIRNYIKEYGERCEAPELKMETVNYKEDPLLFYGYLKQHLEEAPINRPFKTFDYKNILNDVFPGRPMLRLYFELVIRQTIGKIRDRENYRFYRTRVFATARKIFMAMGQQLYITGNLDSSNDVLYLEIDELLDPSHCESYRDIVESRKNDYNQWRQRQKPVRYHESSGRFTPVKDTHETAETIGIRGTGCCSGIAKGLVKIIRQDSSPSGHEGMILVAEYFEPGRIGLFAQAAGIISARGNLLSHTAILCREMGLPTIIGVKGALNKLNDNDLVEMNGATGQINIIKKHATV